MAINKGYLTAKTDKESDEQITPEYAVKPLLKYLKPNLTIWCPFDKEDSNYVKIFKANGYKVLYSHIDEGQNFFYYEPEEPYDLIISNPPFSVKADILKRLSELNKPYAILFPLPSLQGLNTFQYLKDDTQLLIFDKRINFFKNGIMQTQAAFASIYVCKHFLPKDLIFEKLEI